MDVGMSSIQAYKAHEQEGTLVSKVHKQGGTRSAHLPKHPYISGSTACLTTKQFFPIFCNLELIFISYNYDAATDVGMLGKMCRSSAPCLCTLLTSVPSCLCAVCWTFLHPFDFI